MSEIEQAIRKLIAETIKEILQTPPEMVSPGNPVPDTQEEEKVSPEGAEGLREQIEKEEEAKRQCPECGIFQPVSRVTCDVCKTKLYSPSALKAEIERELWQLNKQLRNAIVAGDVRITKEARDRIATQVGASGGKFVVDDVGYAKQAEPLGKKPPDDTPLTPAKMTHLCPCCGEKTAPGRYFLPGHGGRASGLIKKVREKKMKAKDLVPAMQELYAIWDIKKGRMSLADCAKEMVVPGEGG